MPSPQYEYESFRIHLTLVKDLVEKNFLLFKTATIIILRTLIAIEVR
jgi:hypothetical protein